MIICLTCVQMYEVFLCAQNILRYLQKNNHFLVCLRIKPYFCTTYQLIQHNEKFPDLDFVVAAMPMCRGADNIPLQGNNDEDK